MGKLELLDPAIDEYFKSTLGFPRYTPVQAVSIEHFLKKYDCIVQAPTGSGKTLAYVLPMIQILNSIRQKPQEDKCEVLATILAPSRELVQQIAGILKPLADQYNYNVVKLVGGGGAKATTDKPFKQQCIVVGTPARLDHILTKFDHLKRAFKSLEMLIVDEADRFADDEFRTSISTILSCIPKQRRTGLFSATQAKAIEELLKFGLRNPVRINVSDNGEVNVSESAEAIKKKVEAKVAPKELENLYTCVDANHKFLALVNFLNQHPSDKILVFMCSSASVDYFGDLLPKFLKKSKRQFMAVHRRKAHKRKKIIESFAKAKKAILLCTDLMARGLDIVDIDWVVQYDIPKHSSWFVHRSGRTARSGRQGRALLMLTHEEEAYAEFIKNYEHIVFNKFEIDGLSDEAATEMREKIRGIAREDRKILLRGTRAFVSFIEFYIKHDCQVVCKLKDQDLPGLAHSFGLLRLPAMKELRGRKDMGNFQSARIAATAIEAS